MKNTSIDNAVSGIDIFGSWAEIGMVLVAIAAGALIALPGLKALQKKSAKKKEFNPADLNFRELHTRVHEHLSELRILLDAARTTVYHFHNGGCFLDGSSMKKFSLTHQSTTAGVSDTRNECQDVLLSLFIDMLESIVKDEPIPMMTSQLQDCHFKKWLESNHVVLFSIIPIKDASGTLINGFMTTEWCSLTKSDDVDDRFVSKEMVEKRRYIEAELAKQNK